MKNDSHLADVDSSVDLTSLVTGTKLGDGGNWIQSCILSKGKRNHLKRQESELTVDSRSRATDLESLCECTCAIGLCTSQSLSVVGEF